MNPREHLWAGGSLPGPPGHGQSARSPRPSSPRAGAVTLSWHGEELFIYFLFGFGVTPSHTQDLLLAVLMGPYRALGIEPGLSICEESTLFSLLSLQIHMEVIILFGKKEIYKNL